MKAHRVTLIPGDGIGPELVEVACEIVEASGALIDWEVHQIGQPALEAGGTDPVPRSVLESVRRNRLALKGPVTTKLGGTFRSPNIALRRGLDLFAQARPVRSFPGVASRFDDVDCVVIRETTEDLYAGIEYDSGTPEAQELRLWVRRHGFDVAEDSGLSLKPTSSAAARRAVAFAFGWARDHGRRLVTVVHKATVMRATDGLFLDAGRQVSAAFPEIKYEERLVDNVAMQLVRNPTVFDVLVMPNLYGDILSDLAAGLVGGVGLAPGANFGPEVAVFEAAHGSAPKYAGCDRANPTALILSAAMLLRHLGEDDPATRVERAVAEVLREGRSVTCDLARSVEDHAGVGTSAMARAIKERLD